MFDSGITTLNLAISDNPDTFAGPGNIVSYIGASNVGKTVLALTTMAASFYRYGHRPLYYALEPNLMIDIERLYGKKFAKALEVVADLNMTLEQWQADVRARFKAAKKSMVVTLDPPTPCAAAASTKSLSRSRRPIPRGRGEEGRPWPRAAAATAWSKCLSEVTKAVGVNKGPLILTSQVRTNPGVMFGCPSSPAAPDYASEIRIGPPPKRVDDVEVGAGRRSR